MNDDSNGGPPPTKPGTRMVARTTYRMERGRLKRNVRWVSAPLTGEPSEAAPPPKPSLRPPPPASPPASSSASPPATPPAPPLGPLPLQRKAAAGPDARVDEPRGDDRAPEIRSEDSPADRDERRRSVRPYHGGWQGAPEVTIVLRTYNGEEGIEALLDAIKSQAAPFRFDVLAVDARSQDRTLDILSRRGVPVLSVPQEERFIDRAMERASGRAVAFINDRMLPRGAGWLADLVRPVLADPRIAIVTGRQIPGDQRSAYERVTVLTNPNLAGLRPAVWGPGDPGPGATFLPVFNMAISRSAWKTLPLGTRSTSEWTGAILAAGFRKLYLPGATVELGGGSAINRLLAENYRRGRDGDSPLGDVIGRWARQVWGEWRTLNESGLVESGHRGEAYWQALVVRSATLAGALERQKLVRGLTQKLLK